MGLEHRDYMTPRDAGVRGWWVIAPISHKLIVLNVAVFILWQFASLRGFMTEHFTVSWSGLFGAGRVWTPITCAFSHQGLWHLFWNMVYLHWFGSDLEQIYGRRNFLLLYLYGAVVSSLAHVFVERGWGADIPALGASGAVMGVVIVTAIFFPQRPIWVWFISVPLWLLATVKLLGDLTGMIGGHGGVAYAGHLGGALAGVTFKTLDLRLFASPGQDDALDLAWPGPRALWSWLRWRPAPAVVARPRVDDGTASKVDDLLRQISKDGLSSLTPGELDFLKRASERYRGS